MVAALLLDVLKFSRNSKPCQLKAVSTRGWPGTTVGNQESAASLGEDSISVTLPKGMPAFKRPSR